ncbi:DUF2252 family protein [Paraburkholderia terrae]
MNRKSSKSRDGPRPECRQPQLAARRRQEMARSAHAYARGSASLFYQWLGDQKAGALPDGPAVWIGGDCHLGNLGLVSGAGGNGFDYRLRALRERHGRQSAAVHAVLQAQIVSTDYRERGGDTTLPSVSKICAAFFRPSAA